MTRTAEALWCLLDPTRTPSVIDDSHGYLDLLTDRPTPAPHLAQQAMEHAALAVIYERVWRPAFTRLFSYGGAGTVTHTEAMLEYLAPEGDAHVLDVACGPGLYTRRLSSKLGSGGLAVGLDLSAPMLGQAVRDNRGDRTEYLRADAHDVPFEDETFDAVACLAALYLIPDPLHVVTELVRVLAPGGRLGIFTSVETSLTRIPGVTTVLRDQFGANIFGRDEITGLLGDLGMVQVEQQVSGQGQFVSACKPAPPSC